MISHLIKNNESKKKLLMLESLRGIGALAVALYHFDKGSHFNSLFTYHAWLMVDFFFVLSGFVIALNYQSKVNSIVSLYNFQLKRFLRVYPLHILMLFVALSIEIAKYLAEQKLGLVANHPVFTINNLSTFISNVFLIQNLVNANLSWHFASWSISAEFYTYMLFAVLLLLVKKKRLPLLLVSSLIIVMSFFWLSQHGMDTSNTTGPVRCLYSFFLGVICFNIYQELKHKVLLDNSLVGLFFLLLSALAVFYSRGIASYYSLLTPIIFVCTILGLVLTKKSSWINQALSNKYLVYLGTISYGIYMINLTVWWCFNQTARVIFKFPTMLDSYGRANVVFDNIIMADIVTFCGLCLIIYLAHLSYKIIEMPITKYGRKFLK